jgi:phosphoribosylanthranilate isomerase
MLLDSRIKAVGVFVDSTPEFIAELVRNNIIDIVQLHGSEDEAFVGRLRSLLPQGTPVIRAFSVSKSEDIASAEKFPCDFMLLDNGKGGTGQAFAWELLHDRMPDNVFLAGGVNTENITEAIRLNPFCIDVSSGAETDGIKDKNKIIKLVNAVHGVTK